MSPQNSHATRIRLRKVSIAAGKIKDKMRAPKIPVTNGARWQVRRAAKNT